MENFEISLNAQQLERLAMDTAGFLNLLFAPATANYQQLSLELQREFRQGGSPDVTQLAFDRVNYSPTMGKGSLRIVLDVRFTFGCEDSVTEKKDQTSEWTFAVDKFANTIRFYSSPFADSRSTADEF